MDRESLIQIPQTYPEPIGSTPGPDGPSVGGYLSPYSPPEERRHDCQPIPRWVYAINDHASDGMMQRSWSATICSKRSSCELWIR